MKDFLAISVAAIVGANLRYLLTQLSKTAMGSAFPYGVLTINVLGSLVAGFALVWTTERVVADPRWRLMVIVGFCGSFTTFSNYALDTLRYFEQGQWELMLGNVLANNLLCLGAALGGMALARVL